MAKHKKKHEKTASTFPAVPQPDVAVAVDEFEVPAARAGKPEWPVESLTEDERGTLVQVAEDPHVFAQRFEAVRPLWRRWLPDLIKVALALVVIGVAAAIWYQPPLVKARFPYVSYVFRGQRAEDAALFRPLAMPTRYYVALPARLAGRYQWFAVDRRREVVALTEAPRHRVLGHPAIRRSEPLGMDLEFRKLDGSEWRIAFLDDAIVFSNALLTVRLDTRQTTPQP